MGGKQEGIAKPGSKRIFVVPSKIMGFDKQAIRPVKIGHGGQELVEFAVMLPFLLIVLIGVVDLGRVFHASITIANASRAGARYANSFGFVDNDGITLNSVEITTKAQTEAQNSGITLDTVSICCPGGCGPATGCNRGGPVVVTVTHDFQFLFNAFLGSGMTLSHSSEMKIPW